MRYTELFSQAVIIHHREKWLKIGLSTEPLDHERIRKALAKAYEQVGLCAPASVIFVDSPKQGNSAAKLITDQAAIRRRVWDKIMQSAYRRIGGHVDAHVKQQVFDEVYDVIGARIRRAVGGLVIDQAVTATSASALPFFGQYELELPILSIFKNLPNYNGLLPFIELAETSGFSWFFENTAIVCPRPSKLIWSGDRCLVIEYPDGWRATKLSALEQLALEAE